MWLEGWLEVIRVVGHLVGRRHLARTGQGSKAKLRYTLSVSHWMQDHPRLSWVLPKLGDGRYSLSKH